FCGVMPMCSATVLRRILRFASMTSRLTTIGTRAPRSNQEVLLFTHFAADVHDPRDHEYYGPCDQLHERTGTVGFQKGRAAFRRNEIRRDREREPKDGEEQYRDADLSDLLNAFLLEDAALGIVPEQLLQVEEKLEQDRKAEKTADPADHVGRPGYGLTAILREPDAKVAENLVADGDQEHFCAHRQRNGDEKDLEKPFQRGAVSLDLRELRRSLRGHRLLPDLVGIDDVIGRAIASNVNN